MQGPYMGVKEFSEMLGLSLKYTQRLIREGKCPRYLKAGRAVRFLRSDVEQWIKDHYVETDQ